MGFTMTAYDVLRVDFQEKAIAYRGEEGAASFDELKEPRRHQIQFLRAAILELDKQKVIFDREKEKALAEVEALGSSEQEAGVAKAEIEKKYNSAHFTRVLSGLMLMTIEEINIELKNSWFSNNSDFRGVLSGVIGITDGNKLDHNSACAMLIAAKDFLIKSIYVEGLTTEHLLSANAFSKIKGLDIDKFLDLNADMLAASRKSIQQEARAALRDQIILEPPVAKGEEEVAESQEDSDKPIFNKYPLDSSEIEEGSYAFLKKQLDDEAIALRALHRKDKSKPETDIEIQTLVNVSEPRRTQLLFLQAARDELDKSPEESVMNARVLRGLMHIVNELIDSSYKESWATLIFSSDRSTFSRALTGIETASRSKAEQAPPAGVAKIEKLSPEQRQLQKIQKQKEDYNTSNVIISAAMSFIAKCIYPRGDTTRMLKQAHPFTDLKDIDGKTDFVDKFWEKGCSLAAESAKNIQKQARTELKQMDIVRKKEASSSSSYSWWGKSTKVAKEKEPDLASTCTTSSSSASSSTPQ